MPGKDLKSFLSHETWNAGKGGIKEEKEEFEDVVGGARGYRSCFSE